MYMLEAKHVWQQYKKGQAILTDVSLTVPKGQFLSIIGPSGAGKTTLLRLFNGMVKPSKGEVWGDGKRFDTLHGAKKRRVQQKIGMIFQDFCLVKEATALQNVLNGALADMPFWRVVTGRFPKSYQEKAMQCLQQVGLEDKAQEMAAHLSGGQKQRVAIARALMQDAAVLLADEPAGALDPWTAHQILSLLQNLQQKKELTVVMNSHSVQQACQFSQRIVGIRQGKIMRDEFVEAWNKKDFADVYGGHGYEP